MTDARLMVSVIVPTWNSSSTLERCLKSVRAQTYLPIELIVVDNYSSDNTREIAADYCDATETRGPERSAQRNAGARMAHGSYLLFVDSDMEVSSSVVAECVSVIRDTGAPAVIVPEVSVGDGFLARCRALERSCYVGDDSIEAARFFDRADFDRIGGFDEALIAMEDWDVSRRVANGKRLPRAESFITHNEGHLTIRAVLAKKRYYASSSVHYVRKHGRHALSQGNMIFRPAFRRNWRRLLRHPFLTAGFLALKSLEAAAVAWGVIVTPRTPTGASGRSV